METKEYKQPGSASGQPQDNNPGQERLKIACQNEHVMLTRMRTKTAMWGSKRR